MVGEGMLTGAGDGGSHCIQVRKQREEREPVLARLAFFFPFYPVRDPKPWNGSPTPRVGFTSPVQLLWECLHRPAQTCHLGNSKSSQVGHEDLPL